MKKIHAKNIQVRKRSTCLWAYDPVEPTSLNYVEDDENALPPIRNF